MQTKQATARGLALVEALVALTVTAVGMVSVLGVQAVLRQNADLAKQRSEAVRLAQEEIERWRSFSTVAGPLPPGSPAGSVSYEQLDSGTRGTVAGTNTDFTVTRRVFTSAEPAYKSLAVTVSWVDRNSNAQAVQLNTALTGVAPELAATVVVPADGRPVARSNGRAHGIPREAKILSPLLSGFLPPQNSSSGTSQVWKIDNNTGLLTICSTTAVSNETLTLENITSCLPGQAQLLSGFVRFALPPETPAAPTAADAELPPSGPPNTGAWAPEVTVLRTPANLADVNCFETRRSTYLAYYCAVPVTPDSDNRRPWSGRTVVTGIPELTADSSVVAATAHRVCRYTRFNDDRTVGTGSDQMSNQDHPRDYVNVNGPLTNQNYLVIRAGNGSAAYACPADNPSTPLNTTTRQHPLARD